MSTPCVDDTPPKTETLSWGKKVASLIRVSILAVTVLMFFVGNTGLWISSIASLILFGGFAGIVCWQGQGIFYLFFAHYTTNQRLKARDETCEYKAVGFVRFRLQCVRWIIVSGIVGNAVCIVLMGWYIYTGRLKITMWDKISFGISGVVLGIIFLIGWIRKQNMLESTVAVFLGVFVTRIVPQAFLGVSDSLAVISWMILGCLVIIAFQRALISILELAEAIAHKMDKATQQRPAWLLGFSDMLNFGAAVVPCVVKLVRF